MSEIDDVENRGASAGEWKRLNLVISFVTCHSKHTQIHYIRSNSELKSTIWQGIIFFLIIMGKFEYILTVASSC